MFKHEMSEFFLLCLHFFLSFFTYTVYMGVFYVQVHIYCTMYLSIQRPLPHIILSVTQKLNKHLIFHTNTFIYFLNIFSEQYTVRLKSFWSPFEMSILGLVSSNLKSNLLRFHCAHPSLYAYNILLSIYVSLIPFFVFGFWSLLATKLRKYENIR